MMRPADAADRVEPMHRWSTADGVTIAADSWGEPTRPTVLLQHGGGQTRHAWKGTGEALARAGYRAVAFDLRGHGDSGWAPDGLYTTDVLLADLATVVDAVGSTHPVLVGASMGGGASLAAVGEGHVDASALVLVDFAPRMDPDGVDRVQAFMDERPHGFASLEEVADAVAAYRPGNRRPANVAGLRKNVRLGDDGKYHWHWDPSLLTGHPDLPEREARFDACAARLTCPALLVRGAMSDVLTEEGARSFLARCRHAEYVNVRGASHMVAGDRNDRFTAAVIHFLLRTVPPA